MSKDWFEKAQSIITGGSEPTPEPTADPVEPTDAGEQAAPPAPTEGGGPVNTDPTPVEDPVNTDPAPPKEEEQPTPEPVKFNLADVVEEHKDAFSQYIELKGTDFQSMSPEALMERRLKESNPEWTSEDVKAELRDKYGVGLNRIEVNEYDMDEDEIKHAKEHNRQIERGERLLKSDVKEVREFYENLKSEAKLPEIELNPQSNEEEQLKQLQEQYAAQRELWVEQVNGASEHVSSIQRTIEVDDGENGKVALNIDYKLSDAQKQQVSEYLYDYMAHPKDVEKYVKDDGSPDLVKFMADKAILNEDILNSMFRSVAKEAMAIARKEVIKKDILNHDDGVRNRPPAAAGGEEGLTGAQNKAWGRRRN